MKFKAFIDTDVIIDFLIDRQLHSTSASLIFDLADKKKIILCASSLCINNVHYICRKIIGDRKTRDVIYELLSIIEVLSVSSQDISNALKSDFKDFEDAIQHSVVVSDKMVRSIVTRNIKDYKHSAIAVFNPDTFMKMKINEG